MEEDRRVLGNTPHDEIMGRMIERTEQLMRWSDKMERAVEQLTAAMTQSNLVHAQTRETLIKVDSTVSHLTDVVADFRDLDARVRKAEERIISMEGDVTDAKDFKNLVVKWGIIVAIATIAGSTTLGPIVVKLLNLF